MCSVLIDTLEYARMERSQILERLQDALSRQAGIAAAYLLGSAAEGRLRPDSDIDIALLPAGGHAFSLRDRLDMAADLEPLFGRPVDIGIVTTANLVYASEAILKGERIVVRDRDYTAASETRLLGLYLQFREDRREVEEAYRAA